MRMKKNSFRTRSLIRQFSPVAPLRKVCSRIHRRSFNNMTTNVNKLTQPAPTQPAPTQPAPTQPAPTQPTTQNQQSQPLQQRQTQPEVKEPLPSQDGAALVEKTDEDVPTNKTKTEQKEVKKVAPVTKPVSKPAGHGAMINGRPVVYSNKICKHGDSCWSVICPFRHPERENGGRGTAPNEKTKAVPPWKTKECWNWINKGNCPYKDSCYFAHGKKELAKTN